ncbi:MAG TPA: phosphotransferase [Candidatus Kapabacteria bacterium]|nr:phosphotransferase [Candidatus Kapabacteria bacterium]
MDTTYPTVPGRGQSTQSATTMRLEYLAGHHHALVGISEARLGPEQVRNNIESFVGTVEVPLGLLGPLLFRNQDGVEPVHALAGTLEGALIASINRGARAVSLGGGFSAHVLHQKMIRTPMFIFESLAESVRFAEWIEVHTGELRTIAERHSNHAHLVTVTPVIVGKSVHVKFVYTTGDATGQNMTTSCTWHATLWIEKEFEEQTGILIVRCVVEGNGASDKKVSGFAMSHGRGVHAVAECTIPERIVNDVLRTTSDAIVQCFSQSVAMARLDGMVGYNINVANAIAALFVATGQDLGSLHESSCGVLNVERTTDGLYFSLNLPTLVVGTVGGGTALPRQREALELMGCYGSGRVGRFASLIAGFALSLEISTFAAIVGGQFAKAHERLGRNKPVRWLLRSEIDRNFVEGSLNGTYRDRTVDSVALLADGVLDNGILMSLASRVSRRLCGFVPIAVTSRAREHPLREPSTERLLLKIKPLDREVVEGLHFMASTVDTALADLIVDCRDCLEYKDCHIKEIALYEILHEHGIAFTPTYHGKRVDEGREIYLFIQELLDSSTLSHFNAENDPALWDRASVDAVIGAITEIHQLLAPLAHAHAEVAPFRPWHGRALYSRLVELSADYHRDLITPARAERMQRAINDLERSHDALEIRRTIVHNDFNPRNVAMRHGGVPCVYDWELSVIDVPHRDIVEFLCFALEEDFLESDLLHHLELHFALYATDPDRPSWQHWMAAYRYALEVFLVTRVAFYLVGDIVTRYEFAPRIYSNAFRMLDLLEV